MSYFLPKGDYVMMYVILCISIHMMLIVLFVCFPVPFSVNYNSISIKVLTGLNFKKWKEDFLFGMELAEHLKSGLPAKPGPEPGQEGHLPRAPTWPGPITHI